ncbi:MFS transporter [Actinomadura luteofluorescens]|uniref:MFS transporter n=1 Tax=Actinomadura luteofluorescens TaxID=46163 RepID=UPI002164880C|nr:MFS transporter [Actinomadura glauciflava]MCR3746038.1 drug resistance transporter, EmrB/QacA subfamily [Actinomadura glauciflava]
MPPDTLTTQTSPSRREHPTAIVVVLCAAAFMAMLDVFVVNVAFTSIGRSFPGSSLPDLSWMLNAYAIVYAALLIPAGRLADRHSRKKGFLVGLALFTLASVACAFAPSLWWLVAFRVLQAAGAAVLTPTSLGLLLTALPPERRAGAVKVWATTSSLAAALGPVAGGVLLQVSWHWIFLINLPVGLLAFLAAQRLVPDSRDESVVRTLDLTGAAILALAIGAAALGLVKGSEWDWTSARTLTAFGVAILGIAVIAARIARRPDPVIDPALFRVRTFVWANVTVLVFCTAFGALFFSVVLWLESAVGFSEIRTGLAIAPGPLMVPIFAAVGQRMLRRVPVGRVVALGNLLLCAGTLMLAAGASTDPRYLTQILPGWIIIGIGIGLALPSMIGAATKDLPKTQAATGSAVVNTCRQLGYVLGVAILIAVLGSLDGPADHIRTAFQHGWWLIALAGAISAATALGITPARATAGSDRRH